MDERAIVAGELQYPLGLQTMHHPPDVIYYRGSQLSAIMQRPRVAIVGSRAVTPYGQQVTEHFARQLSEHGVVIVSGLALGVDGIAHQAALTAGGITLAVLPTPLNRIAPASHTQLAQRIVEQGGGLLSSYPPGTISHKGHFLQRNEIVAALSDIILITEAAHKSGSLHTASFALDMGKTVFAVPGAITNPQSAGCNHLLASGASPACHPNDIMQALGLHPQAARTPRGGNEYEQCILDLIMQGIHDGGTLLTLSKLEAARFNQTLTMLEITAKIKPLGGNTWVLA